LLTEDPSDVLRGVRVQGGRAKLAVYPVAFGTPFPTVQLPNLPAAPISAIRRLISAIASWEH
jgi:hypothetical protein